MVLGRHSASNAQASATTAVHPAPLRTDRGPVVDAAPTSASASSGYSARPASTTHVTDGFTSARVSTTTVGTVSSPAVAARTRAAADGSAQMSRSTVSMPALTRPRRSREQNGQPGPPQHLDPGR